MDSIISTFHIDWKMIIAQAINFAIVFVVLYIYALKPLSKLMAERSEKIAKGIDDAKSNATLLSKTNQEYEAALSKARIEAQAIFQSAKKEADEKKTAMLEGAKEEVAGIIASGKRSLEAEKIKMVEEAKKEIVELTLKATEKLLSGKADKAYDDKSAKELGNM